MAKQDKVGKAAHAVGIQVLGWILLLGGVVLMPLPGPGALIIFAGVAVLSHHYTWARKARDKTKDGVIEGTKASVANKKRIGLSAFFSICVIAFGVWICLDPSLPEAINFDLLGLEVGPKIPGAGLGSGIFIIGSGVVSLVLLVVGAVKFKD